MRPFSFYLFVIIQLFQGVAQAGGSTPPDPLSFDRSQICEALIEGRFSAESIRASVPQAYRAPLNQAFVKPLEFKSFEFDGIIYKPFVELKKRLEDDEYAVRFFQRIGLTVTASGEEVEFPKDVWVFLASLTQEVIQQYIATGADVREMILPGLILIKRGINKITRIDDIRVWVPGLDSWPDDLEPTAWIPLDLAKLDDSPHSIIPHWVWAYWNSVGRQGLLINATFEHDSGHLPDLTRPGVPQAIRRYYSKQIERLQTIPENLRPAHSTDANFFLGEILVTANPKERIAIQKAIPWDFLDAWEIPLRGPEPARSALKESLSQLSLSELIATTEQLLSLPETAYLRSGGAVQDIGNVALRLLPTQTHRRHVLQTLGVIPTLGYSSVPPINGEGFRIDRVFQETTLGKRAALKILLNLLATLDQGYRDSANRPGVWTRALKDAVPPDDMSDKSIRGIPSISDPRRAVARFWDSVTREAYYNDGVRAAIRESIELHYAYLATTLATDLLIQLEPQDLWNEQTDGTWRDPRSKTALHFGASAWPGSYEQKAFLPSRTIGLISP